MPLNEAVIELPVDTLYLKFSRPKLQYNQFIAKRSLDTYKKQVLKYSDTQFQNSENGDNIVLTNYAQFSSSEINNDNVECIRLMNEGDPNIGLVNHN